MDELTEREGFEAMRLFIEAYWERHQRNSDSPIGPLLGDLSSGLWEDGSPNDPAAWSDWQHAVEQARAGSKPNPA